MVPDRGCAFVVHRDRKGSEAQDRRPPGSGRGNEDGKAAEVVAKIASIEGQKPVGVYLRVRGNQEVCHNAAPSSTARQEPAQGPVGKLSALFLGFPDSLHKRKESLLPAIALWGAPWKRPGAGGWREVVIRR